MRLAPLAAVLAAAAALPACASFAGQEKKDEWFSGSPTGRQEFDRVGPYASVNLIRGFEDFDTGTSAVTADDSDIGIGARAGVHLTPNVAIEGAVESIEGFGLNTPVGDTEVDVLNFLVAGKFYLGTGRVQPYVLAGYGFAEADVRDRVLGLNLDEDGTFARLGVGIDLYITPTVGFMGEVNYNRTFDDLEDFDHFDMVLGMVFRF